MAAQKNKHTAWKWVAGILAILLLAAGGTALYLGAKWKPMLKEKISQGVYEGSDHLYRIDFRDMQLNLLAGSASLQGVVLRPDTATFTQLKAAGQLPVHIFRIELEKLQISRIGILTAYFKKRADLRAILLDKPSISISHYPGKKKADTAKAEKTLYQLLSGTLKSLHIGQILIKDADFNYLNGDNNKPLNTIRHLDVTVKDLLVDSLSQYDTTRFYYTKDVTFSLSGYRAPGKGKMYGMKIDTIRGSAARGEVTVKGFQMIPMYPELEFSRKYTYGHDRYDISFQKIGLLGVDFGKIVREGVLEARSLHLGPAKTNIFVNRELPPPPKFDKVRNFPHIAVRRIPMPMVIDSVLIDNIDVAYTEYNPISKKKGTIYFQNLKGSITNITNDSTRLAKNNHAIAKLSAKVMKASRIDVTIDFNLTDKLAAFSYSGSVAPMNLKVLNPMAKDMGLVEIESGQMQGVTFNIKANSRGSSGTVRFLYSDLKIKLYGDPEAGEKPKKKGLLSFLANTLLIKDNNPDKKGEAPRIARITFTRTPAASFFNQLWKGVFIGLRESAGLGAVPVKTPEQAMKKVREKLHKD